MKRKPARLARVAIPLALLLLALPSLPAQRFYVNNEVAKNGTRMPTPLWDSETSWLDCSQQIMAALLGEVANGHARASKVEQAGKTGVCAAGELGELTQGIEVEVLAPTADSGDHHSEQIGVAMRHVRVRGGKYQGTVGCMPSNRLSPSRVP
jgi:hypothetical protein